MNPSTEAIEQLHADVERDLALIAARALRLAQVYENAIARAVRHTVPADRSSPTTTEEIAP